MNNEIIFLVQLASVIGFIITAFVLYRIYVKQQNATIQLLREKCDFLSLQIKKDEEKKPDKLVESMSKRIAALNEELGRLSSDQKNSEKKISEIGGDFAEAKQEAIQQKKLLSELQKMTSRDALTGLFNKKYLYREAEAIFNYSVDEEKLLSIILIDIDRFKLINDQYGHKLGDKLLQSLSKLMISIVRDIDTLARCGGEEFAILMPRRTSKEAYELAKEIQKRISTMPILEENNVVNFTCSFGIGSINSSDDNWSKIISRADKALYSGKKNGRNQIQVYKDDDM